MGVARGARPAADAQTRALAMAPILHSAQTGIPDRSRGLGGALAVAAAGSLVAAGALLWWSRGPTVFAELALSAFAWCF